MKAVLLAAGKGSRLSPITDDLPKQMISVGGKPLLQYIIEELKSCGIDQVCIVISSSGNNNNSDDDAAADDDDDDDSSSTGSTTAHKSKIQRYFKNGMSLGIKITYAEQTTLDGTAGALRLAEKFVKRDSFVLCLTDILIPEGLGNFFRNIDPDSEATILSSKVSKAQAKVSGTIHTSKSASDNNNNNNNDDDDDNDVSNNSGQYVRKLKEKDPNPTSRLVWAGLAHFASDEIFEAIKSIKKSSRGEYEITDAMNYLISSGKKTIKNQPCKKYLDFGTPPGLRDALRFILKEKERQKEQANQKEKQTPKTRKNPSATFGPNHISRGVKIGKGVKLGPFVSIDKDVKISDSVQIKNSIVLAGASIPKNAKIADCLVSKNSILKLA